MAASSWFEAAILSAREPAPTIAARALAMLSNTDFSWLAYPFTVSTRLGIRSARRCSWFSTCPQAASTCCSSLTMRL